MLHVKGGGRGVGVAPFPSPSPSPVPIALANLLVPSADVLLCRVLINVRGDGR